MNDNYNDDYTPEMEKKILDHIKKVGPIVRYSEKAVMKKIKEVDLKEVSLLENGGYGIGYTIKTLNETAELSQEAFDTIQKFSDELSEAARQRGIDLTKPYDLIVGHDGDDFIKNQMTVIIRQKEEEPPCKPTTSK